MLKEIKYLIFIVIIGLFLFFTGRYYFSDENIKKSYLSYKHIDEKIRIYSMDLPILENDTENIIEYVKCLIHVHDLVGPIICSMS